MTIDYDGLRFRAVRNSETGEVGSNTVFHYHQAGNIVWAEYGGGEVVHGHLVALCDDTGGLDMRYHHINRRCELMTGLCRSTPEMLNDGRIRLYEKWQWTCGDLSSGESVLESY